MRRVSFFFKQKTAYEMRISDWSSDVCSSDLVRANRAAANWLGRSVADMAEQALEAIFPVANAQRIADISRKVSDTGIGQRLKMQSHITADLHYCLDVVPFPPEIGRAHV